MAQQPMKLQWKRSTPYGLSASQFGMALGFCGKVSDYVDYLRNIVGTEQEFTGNECTSHGIATEPKARALYEALTGIEVLDGSFFLSSNDVLGCSPDGRSFYYDPCPHTTVRHGSTSEPGIPELKRPTNNNNSSSPQGPQPASQASPCSVWIPFSLKRRRGHPAPSQPLCSPPASPPSGSEDILQTSLGPASRSGTRKLRLLEIKSPFKALYGCKNSNYKPFGIPLQYMCQMQGQMAIAGADECDFFVYLDSPCQVECWRVKRSDDFWRWAEPKLLEVVEWVRDGPPDWLNRSFAFAPYDFSTLTVEPLVFPYCISSGKPLRDPVHFAFFNQFKNPYIDVVGWKALGQDDEGEEVKIATMVRSPIVKFLFDEDENDTAEDCDAPAEEFQERSKIFRMNSCAPLVSILQNRSWNSLHDANIHVGPPDQSLEKVRVTVPRDWEPSEIVIQCEDESISYSIRLFHRELFGCFRLPEDRAKSLLSTPVSQRIRPSPALDRSEPLSQRIRLQLTPKEEKVRLYKAPGDTVSSIGADHLFDLLNKAEDCGRAIVLVSPVAPIRTFWKEERCGIESTYTLIIAESDAFSAVCAVTKSNDGSTMGRNDAWHRSVMELTRAIGSTAIATDCCNGETREVFVICLIHKRNAEFPVGDLPFVTYVIEDDYPEIILNKSIEVLNTWNM